MMHSLPMVAPWRMWTESQTEEPGPMVTPSSRMAVGWMRTLGYRLDISASFSAKGPPCRRRDKDGAPVLIVEITECASAFLGVRPHGLGPKGWRTIWHRGVRR